MPVTKDSPLDLPILAEPSTSSFENLTNSRNASSNSLVPSRFTSFPMRTTPSPISEHGLTMASQRKSAQFPTSDELKNRLDPSTRFAVANLLVTVLKLDFYRIGDEQANKFCKNALNLIVRYCALPDKTNASLRVHMASEHPTEDVASLIGVIKSDAYVKEHGCIVFLSSMLVMAIEGGDYDSRYRVMLRHISALLGVLWDDFELVEDTLTDMVISEQYVESDDSKVRRLRSQKIKKIKRYMMIGAAGSIGGVLIGLTGGLAAPLVATGAGVVIGTGAAAGIATTAGAAILGSAFGMAGAGLAGYKMNKRVGAIEEFEVETLSNENSLHVVLCVSGWIDDENNEYAFHQQWRHLWMSKEQYTLRYESKYLLELGKAIDYLMSFAVSYAIQHTLMETALAGLMTAIAWPVALLSCSSVLDNPWNVCVSRAAEVGEHLAEVLLTRQHGKRPITLIGFSLGARVIYHCLLGMSKRPDCVGIIEDVVLLGAPVSASPTQWKQMCTVVGGRVINGYCTSDWLLKFLYRTMSVQFTIAGTGPVESKSERKIVNFNLSHIVKGHMDYSKKLTEVLEAVGVKITPHSQESSEDLKKYEEVQETTQTTDRTKTAKSFSPPPKSDKS